METPSSTTRVTRSQTRAALSNSTHNISTAKNGEETEKNMQTSSTKIAKQDRSALVDITNDSPIVGLAERSSLLEMETPISSVAKRRRNLPKSTPGSGEALLRGQVKTLLQKVEEEAEISKFLGPVSHCQRTQFLGLRGIPNSPMGVLAPTPVNTPQVFGYGEEPIVDDFATEFPIEEQLKISQVVTDLLDGKMVETSVDYEKSLITRSLFFDFSEKSDLSSVDSSSSASDCSPFITYQSSKEKLPSTVEEEDEEEEEDASIWSIQVNASTQDIDEDIESEKDEGKDVEEEDFYNKDYDEEDEDEDVLVDELCEGMSKISVVASSAEMVRFEGKHTRFVYNSEDEIEGEDEVVHLKGLPTPKGKHLRFAEEDDN